MKIFLMWSATLYLIALWVYAGVRHDSFLSRAKTEAAKSESTYERDDRSGFAFDCHRHAACPSELTAFLLRVDSQMSSGRRFVWLPKEIEPPSYRTREVCDDEAGDCQIAVWFAEPSVTLGSERDEIECAENASDCRLSARLSKDRVSLSMYRAGDECDEGESACRSPSAEDHQARFEIVSACNPRIAACD